MKKIYILKKIVLVSLLASFCCLTSCDDDEEVRNNGEVALLSFGPSGVKHGDKIQFIGWNLDKVSSIVFSPSVEIGADAFLSQSSEVIELIVPTFVESGRVVMRTPTANIESKSVFSLEVPVSITSFTLEAKPGTNVTVTGEFVNWIEAVVFPDDVIATEFVSRSLSEVVFVVPMEARSGSLTFLTGGTVPLEIEPEEEILITLPSVEVIAPTTIERGAELTITGTDLDLVKAVSFKGGITVPELEFVSKSETEIVVVFPLEANKGTITLVAYSDVEIESDQALEVIGDLPPLEALAFEIYVDELANGWSKWGGWGGGTADLANADNVRDGQKAIKAEFVGGWGGAFQIGSDGSPTAGFEEFAISIYGDAGTGGKEVNLILKDGEDATKEIVIGIIEGEWTEYRLLIADDLDGIANISEITMQDRDWSGILYIDHIGLR